MHGTLRSLPVLAAGLILVAVACRSQKGHTSRDAVAETTSDAEASSRRPQAGAACLPVPHATNTAVDVAQELALPMPPPNSVHVGRLLTVYGLAADGRERELYAKNVFVPPKWHARVAGEVTRLSCNPDSLQGRVLIRAPIGSAEFAHVMARLTEPVVNLPVTSGDDTPSSVPRNAAMRVTFESEAAAACAVAENKIRILVDGGPLPGPVQQLLCGRSVLCNPAVAGLDALVLCGKQVTCLPPGTLNLQIAVGEGEVSREFVARGWLPDADPVRLVGDMRVYLEQVGKPRSGSRMLTLFMADIEQRLDCGDVLRVCDPVSGKPLAALDVLEDVVTPDGHVDRVHVRVCAAGDAPEGDWLELLDPSNLPGFPRDNRKARDAFLLEHAPTVRIRALFEVGDPSSNFVNVSGQVVCDTDGNRKNIAPDANYELRFSQPVDCGALQNIKLIVATEKNVEVPVQLFEHDATALQVSPPLGLPMTPAIRDGILARREKPGAWRANFRLEVLGGQGGVRSSSGVPLPHSLQFGFSLDPTAELNMVGWKAF